MSIAIIVALVLLVAGLAFPILALRLRPKHSAPTRSDDEIVEMKASLLFLNTALPTLLLLIGALGFASYDDIVKKVSAAVKADYSETINKAVIDSLVADIRILHGKSGADKKAIEALLATVTVHSQSVDSILQSTQTNAGEITAIFVQALPKGTIIPYYGLRYNFDKTMWALCDGSNNTPDLRDRFVLGSSFENVGDKGGERQHEHTARLDIDGTVTKKSIADDTRFSGPSTGFKFKVEKHEHVFNISRQKAAIDGAAHLPPYYRLVYLMKIK